MGYGRALLMRDVKQEEEAFQKKAKKKSLWGSIGRTLGGLAAMGLTGGIVNPWTVGAITAATSFAGGALGAKASGGKLTGGRFFQADRESAQKELGAFGSRNIVGSLQSGITAGIGQKLKLMKEGGLSSGKQLGKELVAEGEASLATGRGVAGRRGYMAPGEITSKVTKAEQLDLMSQGRGPGVFREARGGGAITQDNSLDAILQGQSDLGTAADKAGIKRVAPSGMGTGDAGSLWDQYSPTKVEGVSEKMINKKSIKGLLENYFAPGEKQLNAALYHRYPEMFEGASPFPKQYTSGASTVIGGR